MERVDWVAVAIIIITGAAFALMILDGRDQ